jgi:hypothetical protein
LPIALLTGAKGVTEATYSATSGARSTIASTNVVNLVVISSFLPSSSISLSAFTPSSSLASLSIFLFSSSICSSVACSSFNCSFNKSLNSLIDLLNSESSFDIILLSVFIFSPTETVVTL